MDDDGWSDLIAAVIIIGLVAGIGYFVYWMFTMKMKTFEILFGNGWWYIVFWIFGYVLSRKNIPFYETHEKDILHVNLGGCVLPIGLSVFLLYKTWYLLNPTICLGATLGTIIISRAVSWYVKGRGVLIEATTVEIASTLIAHFLPFSVNYLDSNPLSLKLAFGYIIGTIGVLIGADLLHMGMIGRDGKWRDKLSIGGAGTKDAIWSIGLGAMFLILLSHYWFGW